MIKKVSSRYSIGRPRVVVGVPSGITEVEERAVEESVIQAGAREVYIIEEPMAAAIGAGINITEPSGSMIVDIGGGTTEVAVISLGGIVVSNSLRIAGDELDEDIVNYIRREENLSIGETTAEQIKMQIGCATPLMTDMPMEIRGRDLTTGLPRNITVKSSGIMEATAESIAKNSRNCKTNIRKNTTRACSRFSRKRNIFSRRRSFDSKLRQITKSRNKYACICCKFTIRMCCKWNRKNIRRFRKTKNSFSK